MHPELQRDIILGTFYGMAVGDALGTALNGRTRSEIDLRWGSKPLRMEGIPRKRIRPGDYCDGTGQALTIMESFNACCGFEALDCAGRLVDWFELCPKGAGYFSRDILSELADDPERYATVARDYWIRKGGVPAGSGALTRCLVPAVFYLDDLDKMVETTIHLSQITHFDPRCVEAALVLNFILFQCLHRRFGQRLVSDAAVFLNATRNTPLYNRLVHRYSATELQENTNYSPFPRYDIDHDAVVDRLSELPTIKYEQLHNTGKCSHTMQTAIWCLMHSDSYEKAVSFAVRLGGEASIQGAVAGALAGACHGLSGIPSDWITQVQDSRRIANDSELLISRSSLAEERDYREGRREPTLPPPRVL